MKHLRHLMLVLACVAALVATACQPITRAQLITALTDARWGLREACTQTWVGPKDCAVGESGLTTAIDIATNASPQTMKADVLASLRATVTRFTPDGTAPPFVNYLIIFLSA